MDGYRTGLPGVNLVSNRYVADGQRSTTRSDIGKSPTFQSGEAMLGALREIAVGHACPPAAVALAGWRPRPGVVAPIASARTPRQLADLLPMAGLELTQHELTQLDTVSSTIAEPVT
jgi:aryl-alcohol dehydrogenase-like predicted oxidoreductase